MFNLKAKKRLMVKIYEMRFSFWNSDNTRLIIYFRLEKVANVLGDKTLINFCN